MWFIFDNTIAEYAVITYLLLRQVHLFSCGIAVFRVRLKKLL